MHVYFEDFNLDTLPGLDHLVRRLDEAVGQLGDVHQGVLARQDFDEGAKAEDTDNLAGVDLADLDLLALGSAATSTEARIAHNRLALLAAQR